MMASKLPCVVPTCTRSGLVHGLSRIRLAAPTTPWLRTTADRYRVGIRAGFLPSGFTVCLPAPQSLRMDEDRDAALVFYGMQPLIFDGTRRTVSLVGWLYDMELICQICHIEVRLQVLLASQCLVGDARLWWLTLGEPTIPEGSRAYFRALIIARYGPLRDEEANMPYRDPEIYNDMYLRRYLSYVTDWHAYPNESMAHYCQIFQDAMLPCIPRDLGSLEMQALHLLREGLSPKVWQFVPAPMMGVTLESMIDVIMEAEIVAYMLQAAAPENDYLLVPVDDAGIREPLFQGDNDDMDPAYFLAAPEDNPEDPPVIIIASDDDDEDIEEELEDLKEQEEDPEEILFNDDEEWDVFSDITTDLTCTGQVLDTTGRLYSFSTLQRQLLEQQQENNQLREQIASLNQIPYANVVPHQDNLIPPVASQVPEGHQGVPQNIEVSLAPVGVQANPPLVREDLLYEWSRRMKAPEFEGTTDPIEADKWLIDIQVILDFMGLIEQEKVLCASFALKKDARHWWMTVQMRRNVDKEARAQIFKAKKEEKAVVKQTQLKQNHESYPKGHTSNSAQNSKQFGKNKKKGNDASQEQQGITFKKRATEEMDVITIIIPCAPNVERSIWECVDWGQTPATFMARKASMRGIVP
ncbi:hypothetical protein TIFTF001_035116 [Ficus carica]|uniref:Retrotransposon gag domain-containing protein n=1 Tax=Ficus carica TaxID=3494 RepID=A0AA88E141_FICCA|nr:hypothetical protein TIFTF001_035116 [Ficus carica]